MKRHYTNLNRANYLVKRALGTATALGAGRAVNSLVKYVKKSKVGVKSASNMKGLRTRTRTMRRRKRETLVPNGEYTRQSVVKGRRYGKTLKHAWKLIGQNMSHNVYRYSNYSLFGGTNGTMYLSNVSATASTGALDVPLHTWDLTAAINAVGGVVTRPFIYSRPVFSNPLDTATLSWANDGLGQISLENGDQATGIVNNYPLGSDTLDWVQAKLLFYCPTTLPCRFQIDVVQFNDTRVLPGETNAFAISFYQAMIKKFAYSPLEPGDHKYVKLMKVLHTQSFILNPKETTEAVNTIFREVNVFLRLNRKCTYDWSDQDKMAMLTGDFQTNTDTTIQTTVHPRARIFLVIRAQSRNAAAISSTIHPSYDIMLRVKHSQFSG